VPWVVDMNHDLSDDSGEVKVTAAFLLLLPCSVTAVDAIMQRRDHQLGAKTVEVKPQVAKEQSRVAAGGMTSMPTLDPLGRAAAAAAANPIVAAAVAAATAAAAGGVGYGDPSVGWR